MIRKKVNEATKKRIEVLTPVEYRDNCGMSFIPNQETIDAIEENERIKSGEIEGKKYSSFEEMWSDICGT